MSRFTVIPRDTFEGIQLDAGVLLRDFDPETGNEPDDEDIICATTGGISVSCVPKYSDMGEDVDNCPVNMMELMHLDGWDCKMSFTSIGTSLSNIRMALGAADINAATSKITPRRNLQQDDFDDIWWVGDRADGGMVAILLKNALSTAGLTLHTTKAGKGQISVELTGHVSIEAQDDVPMGFYSADPPTVSYTQATLTSAGFKIGETYYTRTGAGTSESPYIYTKVASGTVYNSSKTYYVKTYS